jgi:ammonium transporter, Amt family
VSTLLLAHQLLSSTCPDPSTLGSYPKFAPGLVDSAGVTCAGTTAQDSGDNAWMLTSSALVLLMTPGLAFFYGGMVRAKHVLGMLIQNYMAIAIVSVTWILIGFTWAFSGTNKFLGDTHFIFMRHVADVVPTLGSFQTIPTLTFVAFQATFAIITPALITGATADRWKFGSFVTFVTIWSVVIYAPVAHWVFDGYGLLNQVSRPAGKFFAEDFAGGTVVHIDSGAAALAVCIVLGKRRGWGKDNIRGHNIPFVMLGAALLWFGWFGFNAGSAVEAHDALAAYAWVNTNTATATALIGWILVEKLRYGKSTALGAASGAVAGLVAITPCSGFVSPMGSIFVGLIAGAVCCYAIGLKNKLGYDDALDVVGVHFVGGWTGTILVGFLSTSGTNSLANNGVLYGGKGKWGGWSLVLHQIEAAGMVTIYSFVGSLILISVIGLVFKNRVSEEAELEGLDIAIHGESAYEFGPIGGAGAREVAQSKESKESVTA